MKILTKRCKTNIGGVKDILIAPFVSYNYEDIKQIRGYELISIPAREFFTAKVSSISFNENQENDSGGAVSYKTDLSFTIWDNQEYTTEINKMTDCLYNVVLRLNNGSFFYLGVSNGLRLESSKFTAGNNKSDMIGFSLSFSGSEEFRFLRFKNLSQVGIIEVKPPKLIGVLASKDRIVLTGGKPIKV